ncbi:unnamed protein product [Paramecium sonneborni]|uniref:G domain-containing protein n=1 Tax=Paramecium sonneborni TaxID=65129 RepID=A0A8S1RR65_9CILI|nr:unnamed protein product [Paramecium sonneborni]
MLKNQNVQEESQKRIILYFNLEHSNKSLMELKNIKNLKIIFKNSTYIKFEQKQQSYVTQLYYFQGIFQENSNDAFDINKLTQVKINLLQLVQQFNKSQIKVILQYKFPIQQEQQQIDQHIYQLFDGFLIQQQNIVLLQIDENQYRKFQINLFLLSKIQKRIQHSIRIVNKKKQNLRSCQDHLQIIQIHLQVFSNLNKMIITLQPFQFYLYLKDELEVLTLLFLKNIRVFQLNIYQLLELPTNLNYEKKDENFQQLQKLLRGLLCRFHQIINQRESNIKIIVSEIHSAILHWEPRIQNYLKYLAQKDENVNSFIMKEKIFLFNYEKVNNEVIEGYKTKELISRNFTQDIVKSYLEKEMKIISQQCTFEIKYFDFHLPSKLKMFQELNNFSIKQNPINKTNVCLLGLTKTGKSTLLNILINPNNIEIIEIDNKKYFSIIKQFHNITISQITDTPGFFDTDNQTRLINQVKIFTQLQRSPQVIFLILIDGQQLCENINDFYQTIEHFYLFFGDRLIESQLEKFIIPVFNKLKSNTMNKIKDRKLKKLVHKSYQKQIEIYKASHFLYKNEIQQLEKQKMEINNKINKLLGEEKLTQEIKDLNKQVIKLQNQIDFKQNQRKQINYGLLENIKQQILNQCKYLQQEQNQQKSKIVFTLALNPDMKEYYNTILKYQDEICELLLKLITDVITNNLLNDHSRNVDDVIEQCNQIDNNIKEYKSKENNISVFSFFYSLRQKFLNVFENQRLIEDLINKLNSINNLSQFILNGQRIKEISTQYLENELNLIRQSCNNVCDNKDFKDFLSEKKYFNFQIIFFRLITQTEKAKIIKQRTKEEEEKLKMEILKIEYNELKKSQETKKN